jgi:hypothetical protein
MQVSPLALALAFHLISSARPSIPPTGAVPNTLCVVNPTCFQAPLAILSRRFSAFSDLQHGRRITLVNSFFHNCVRYNSTLSWFFCSAFGRPVPVVIGSAFRSFFFSIHWVLSLSYFRLMGSIAESAVLHALSFTSTTCIAFRSSSTFRSRTASDCLVMEFSLTSL